MATNNYENAVFVSYASGGESERMVDELEQAFAERDIRIVRDKKDIGYKGSIDTFEQRIGQGQCIVLVISDKYLRSEHCMYELMEADKNQNLRDRIFPIVLAEAQIYKAIDRLNYIEYWDKQIEQLNQAIIKRVKVMANVSGITADLDKYTRIRANFDHLTDLLSDMNALTPEIHTASGFSTLISAVERALVEKKTVPIQQSNAAKPDEISENRSEQLPSVLVIGHRLDADVQCVLWDEDEPNIADYDIVIVDLTINRKPLLPLYRPRLWHDPQFNKLNYLNWTHTRSRIESLVSSGGMIFFIIDSSLVKHIDSPESHGDEYSRLLPFTLYGELTPIGTSIEIVDSRFDFYFSSLGSWNFIFSDQIHLDFEHTSNYKIRPIAQNRANESLGISIELNSDKPGKPGWIYILPKPSNMTSFEAIKLLVSHQNIFA